MTNVVQECGRDESARRAGALGDFGRLEYVLHNRDRLPQIGARAVDTIQLENRVDGLERGGAGRTGHAGHRTTKAFRRVRLGSESARPRSGARPKLVGGERVKLPRRTSGSNL